MTDTSFNSNGKVTTALGLADDVGLAVALQADSKVLVVGSSFNGSNNDFALVRYNTNGSLDTAFNSNGKVMTDIASTDDTAESVAVQSDGKILVAGTSDNGTNADFAVERYNANGTLDSSFDSNGIVTTAIMASADIGNAVTLQANGKILVAGTSWNGANSVFALARYNSDGSLDTSFDTDGMVTTAIRSLDGANAVTVQSDGKIVVAGYSTNVDKGEFAVIRYNADGSLDNTFKTNTLDGVAS